MPLRGCPQIAQIRIARDDAARSTLAAHSGGYVCADHRMSITLRDEMLE
jgi:hypothetical protein